MLQWQKYPIYFLCNLCTDIIGSCYCTFPMKTIICACCHFKVFSCTNYNWYTISCCHKSLPWQTGWKPKQKFCCHVPDLFFSIPIIKELWFIWLSKTNEGWELLFGMKIMTRNLKLDYPVKLNLLPANWMFTDTTNLLAP